MNVINAAITIRPETKDVSFFWSVPPKTKATLQVLNEDETALISVPYDNNTGRPKTLTIVLPFETPVSRIPTLVVG